MKQALVRWMVCALVPALLQGCKASGAAPHAVTSSAAAVVAQVSLDQTHICEVNGWQKDLTEAKCRAGQKVVFLPDRWGNAQLPILFAAVNCDLRYAVALTNGAVTCIYVGPLAREHDDATPAKPASSAPHPVSTH